MPAAQVVRRVGGALRLQLFVLVRDVVRELAYRIAVPVLRRRARRRLDHLRPGAATVVTVNWNGRQHLEALLRIVRRRSPPGTEIVVVDNGSRDGSRRLLRRADPSVRRVLLPLNVGHDLALNLGFLLSRTEYVVALDVDAFPIRDGWLDELVEPLSQGAQIAGARLNREYVHPCCLAMRTARFVEQAHSFRHHYRPRADGRDASGEVGEEMAAREAPNLRFFEVTSQRGPGDVGPCSATSSTTTSTAPGSRASRTAASWTRPSPATTRRAPGPRRSSATASEARMGLIDRLMQPTRPWWWRRSLHDAGVVVDLVAAAEPGRPRLRILAAWWRLGLAGRRTVAVSVRVRGTAVRLRVADRSQIEAVREVLVQEEYDVPVTGVRTIVDAGANAGMATLYLHGRHPGARIVAVEPDPGTYDLLEANTAALPGVTCVCGALADRDGTVVLHTGAESWAASTRPGRGRPDAVVVAAETLETLAARHGLDRIDLLKLDVEGAEAEVLLGPGMQRVGAVVFEYHAELAGIGLWDLLDRLDGFRLLRLDGSSEGHALVLLGRRA